MRFSSSTPVCFTFDQRKHVLVCRIDGDVTADTGGWATGRGAVDLVYRVNHSAKQLAQTHGFEGPRVGEQGFFYPYHGVLCPPDDIVALIFGAVLDVSEDVHRHEFLDVVAALAYAETALVRLSHSRRVTRALIIERSVLTGDLLSCVYVQSEKDAVENEHVSIVDFFKVLKFLATTLAQVRTPSMAPMQCPVIYCL